MKLKKELGIGAILLVVCVFLAIKQPVFLSKVNLQNTSNSIGEYGIFSIGLGIVIITGGIDLSVGSAFAVQGVLFSIMLQDWQWPWPMAVLGSIAALLVLGVFHGFMIAKVRLQPFIVTLCGLLIYRGMANWFARDATRGVGVGDNDIPPPLLQALTAGKVGPFPITLVILLIVAAIMWVVLHHSVFGRYLYAVGRNEDAARYSGINTKMIIGSAYVVSMLLAGISGILFAMDVKSIQPSSHGLSYELYGIAAAVLGGCSLRGGEGSILGILLGTALLVVLQNLVNLMHLPTTQTFTVMGFVILAGVTFDQVIGNRKKVTKVGAPALAPSAPSGTPGPQ
jgi:ribose transport system permease protein